MWYNLVTIALSFGMYYSQIHCFKLHVLQTLKEFWVFLFRQSSLYSHEAVIFVVRLFEYSPFL